MLLYYQFHITNIGSHQGCTAEDIIKGNKDSGRVKTFRILKDLKKRNVIREEKSDTNKRDKKLFLNETNPLLSFPKEVKSLKTVYTHYLKKRNTIVCIGATRIRLTLVLNFS